MTASDPSWWSQHLGGHPAPPPQQPQAPQLVQPVPVYIPAPAPPQGYAQPQQSPYGVSPVPQGFMQPGYPQPVPSQPFQQPYQGPGPYGYQPQPQGYAPPQARSLRNFSNCPRCGSPNYMHRASENPRLPPPAPLCTDCGYKGNDAFDQSQDIVGSAARVENPNLFVPAAQAGPTHAVGSWVPGYEPGNTQVAQQPQQAVQAPQYSPPPPPAAPQQYDPGVPPPYVPGAS